MNTARPLILVDHGVAVDDSLLARLADKFRVEIRRVDPSDPPQRGVVMTDDELVAAVASYRYQTSNR